MSRKKELLEMARLLRSQADGMSSRDAKQAFRKMADYYEQEANYKTGLLRISSSEAKRRIRLNRLHNY
jgi:hypothetical protein